MLSGNDVVDLPEAYNELAPTLSAHALGVQREDIAGVYIGMEALPGSVN